MIRLERLRADHIAGLKVQAAQQSIAPSLTLAYGRDLAEQPGVGWAAVEDGRVLGCAGVVEVWRDRGIAWALFSEDALRHWTRVHRATLAVLEDAPWRRIEMHVDVGHAAAARWAERLHFQYEGRMRAFTSDGRDCFLYARVR